MELGMIGLGRMGANMARRLLKGGHDCVVYDRKPEAATELVREGAHAAASLSELVAALAPPRAIWLMLPAGEPTEATIRELQTLIAAGDVLIDGGNTFYKDDVRRARELEPRGIRYLDVGTSGGVWGFERGYCLMVGGSEEAFVQLEPLFVTLAPGHAAAAPTRGREARRGTTEEGYLYCGPAGAGHFVKMVHNGIEYGLMQAYAEGFDLLASAARTHDPEATAYDLDLPEIAELWRRGSVVGSWLLDLTAAALAADPDLSSHSPSVEDSGEGRWALDTAIEHGVPSPALAAALFARFRSRHEGSLADRMLSALRHQFGGHGAKG